MFQIDNGLGSITVGSDTLLKTAQLTDEGGALGNPSAAACAAMGEDGEKMLYQIYRCICHAGQKG